MSGPQKAGVTCKVISQVQKQTAITFNSVAAIENENVDENDSNFVTKVKDSEDDNSKSK